MKLSEHYFWKLYALTYPKKHGHGPDTGHGNSWKIKTWHAGDTTIDLYIYIYIYI